MTDSIETLSKSQLFTLKGEVILGGAGGGAQQSNLRGAVHHVANEIIDQKYKIICLLGEGGMGAVYKAEHLLLNKEVALKTFRSSNLTDDSWLRFQREAKAIARLTHRNIVQVFDFGVDQDNVPYYTMECLVGESLAERLKAKAPLEVEESLTIFLQVCLGLSLAHSKGIVHRDLKPANIFLTAETYAGGKARGVKIVDFGLAGLATGGMDEQKLTTTGSIFGSPLYMSPEQSLAGEVTESSDIYSCGCSLFETFTGSPPYRGENAFATMLMHQQSAVPRLDDLEEGRHLPQRLKTLITKMLAKRPQDRPQSFDAVASDLEEVLRGQNQSSSVKQLASAVLASTDNQQETQETTRSSGIGRLALVLCIISALMAAAGAALTSIKSKPLAKISSIEKKAEPKMALETNQDPGYFLQKDQSKGPKWRHFFFPKDESLGTLEWKYPDGTEYLGEAPKNLQAQGSVFVPRYCLLHLKAQEVLSTKPKLFRGFTPADLDEITLVSYFEWNNTHIEELSRLTNLRSVEINKSSVSNDCIESLNKLPLLSSLCVAETPLTGDGLVKLKRLPALFWLAAGTITPITPVLNKMAHNKKAYFLGLEGCQLTSDDLKVIATMPNLTWLNLAENIQVTDCGLASLTTLKKLRTLKITGTSVTSHCIDTLKQLPTLSELKISFDTWSPGDREKLRKALPHCLFPDPSMGDQSHGSAMAKSYVERN